MPPKKTAKAATPATPPLDGCIIALSGTFTGRSQPDIERHLIKPLGASLTKTVTQTTTHLVTTDADYNKPSTKAKQAKDLGIEIVTIDWLEACLSKSSKLKESDYSLSNASPAPSAPAKTTTTNKTNGSRKRGASDDADTNASQSAPQTKKKATAAVDDNSQSSKPAPQADKKKELPSRIKSDESTGETNIAKSKNIEIQLDEHCQLLNYRVYIDDNGLIFDASLNQTNSSNNNNKFYRIQLLRSGSGDSKVWTRWGRVGDYGQTAILGSGSLDDALKQFDKKFKDKSGLTWANRADKPKSGKYTFVERSYEPDDSEEEEDAIKEEEEDRTTPESDLAPEVQQLMELIFNQDFFAATMKDLNYDVHKLPLGKLGHSTIKRGYQTLKDLSELINDPSLAQSQYDSTFAEATEQLSNAYYSFIPHVFGRNRPPIISDNDHLKKEVELLDSLSDMKEASNIMKKKEGGKDVEHLNKLDQQFKGLNLDEMTPLKQDSEEFAQLKEYLFNTRGQTHNHSYLISDIFRIDRNGEKKRFQDNKHKIKKDTRLLWHGSRVTNFGGILSQGLRIAPPEAPVSGYMFGKGIYLADMASKSANYCCSYSSGGHALLLLCEAELGDPIQKLINSSYNAGEDAKKNGMLSTWGQGQLGPPKWKDAKCVHKDLAGVKMPDTTTEKPTNLKVPGASLMYNEFIVYDVAQVRLRYLFRVKM